MVKLEPVEDEHFAEKQSGLVDDDDAYYTDTDSSASDSDAESVTDLDTLDETILDRIVALRDIIPPKQRAAITSRLRTTYSWLSSGVTLGGKTLWVLSTSALLLGVPYVLAVTEEQQYVDAEKEQNQQKTISDVIAPGTAPLMLQPPGGAAS